MSQRRIMNGIVISDKMDKTVVISVKRIVQHPRYKKYIRKMSKFKAHDEKNECKLGDKVLIMETKPLSREKRWIIKEIIKKGI